MHTLAELALNCTLEGFSEMRGEVKVIDPYGEKDFTDWNEMKCHSLKRTNGLILHNFVEFTNEPMHHILSSALLPKELEMRQKISSRKLAQKSMFFYTSGLIRKKAIMGC